MDENDSSITLERGKRRTQVVVHTVEPGTSLRNCATTLRELYKSTRSIYNKEYTLVILLGSIASSIVFWVNIGLLVFSLVRMKLHDDSSFVLSYVYSGSCRKTKYATSVLHLFINLLSTILLAASNYASQVLAAPTRSDVDRSHAAGRSLDIGMPSLRNLLYLNSSRGLLCVLLLATSIPLHLFYNAMIMSTAGSNNYYVLYVTGAFFGSTPPYIPQYDFVSTFYGIDKEEMHDFSSPISKAYALMNKTLGDVAKNAPKSWKNLTIEQCSKIYSAELLTEYRNLIFVVDPPTASPAYFESSTSIWPPPVANSSTSLSNGVYFAHIQDRPYMCLADDSTTCKDGIFDTAVAWDRDDNFIQYPIRYCLAEPWTTQCRIGISPLMAIIVLVLNFTKTVTLFTIARRFKLSEASLATLGDTLASFLSEREHRMNSTAADNASHLSAERKILTVHKRNWLFGAPKSLWLACIFAYASCLPSGIYLLYKAVSFDPYTAQAHASGLGGRIKGLWAQGLGEYSIVRVVQVSTNFVAQSIIANCPQLIISFLFLLFNALLTSMHVNKEFTAFATKRSGLRVSEKVPGSRQRSTYFLALPYRFSIPLLTTSFALHYFASQSLFIAKIDYQRMTTGPTDMRVAWDKPGVDLVYSPLGILLTIIVGSLVPIAVVILAFRKYNSLMPLGGTNSANIAAACHKPEWDVDAALKEVMWGEVQIAVSSPDEDEEPVPHLCFTSGEVLPAREHIEYY